MKIKLSNGLFTEIDASDFELVSEHKWTAKKCTNSDSLFYAVTLEKPAIRMHRLLLGASKAEIVDHINGDSLDNRRSNLRIVSHRTNIINSKLSRNNSSGVKGVCFDKQKQQWRAYFHHNKKMHSKNFNNKEDAIQYRRYLEDTFNFEAAPNSGQIRKFKTTFKVPSRRANSTGFNFISKRKNSYIVRFSIRGERLDFRYKTLDAAVSFMKAKYFELYNINYDEIYGVIK